MKAPNAAVAMLTTALESDSDLVSTVTAELEAVKRLSTVAGQQALALARRVDSSHETGAAVAALSRELRAVMEVALEGVSVAADPLDELKARRDRLRSG